MSKKNEEGVKRRRNQREEGEVVLLINRNSDTK